MAAYVVVDIVVHDATLYEEYKALAPASIEMFGGRYLARGGASEALEGEWRPQRLVILEFPDLATARAWWASAEYERARSIRQRAASAEMVVVEGASS